jgi:HPt (histidine-containing phosphotransfer) domain-containing protein
VTLDRLGAALAKCQPRRESADDAALDRRVLDQIREDLGGTAPLRDVILTFLGKTPAVLATLHDAAVRADANAIRRAAHSLKGTSALLGARALAEQCAELERLDQADLVADALGRVRAIDASYRKVEAALTAEVESSGSVPGQPSAGE